MSNKLCDTFDRSSSRLEWACCSGRSGGRRGWSSPTRSTAGRPSQRSCDSLTLSHTRCRQSAPGATPFPEPSPPAPGNKPVHRWSGSHSFWVLFEEGFPISHLSYHRFLAGRAVSFGGRLDALSAQVRLEQSQHAVQRAARRWLRRSCGWLRRCHHGADRYRWLREEETHYLHQFDLLLLATLEKSCWSGWDHAGPFGCVCAALTVLWTRKSDRDAISLSSSRVADVAEGLAVLKDKRNATF